MRQTAGVCADAEIAGSEAGTLGLVSESHGHRVIYQGRRIRNPTKKELAFDIADALSIARPSVSNGSSVDSTFLDRVHTALTGDKSAQSDAYRRARVVLQDLGLTYDPFWDTSESSKTGGSTVTNRAYSRIRSAIIGAPRCFLVRGSVGVWAHPDIDARYRFDDMTTGRSSLTDAGPGSRILFYDLHKESTRFVAHGEVSYVRGRWTGPRTVEFSDLARLSHGIVFSSFGLSVPIADITEVSFETYQRMLMALGKLGRRLRDDKSYEPDPGGVVVARRILTELPLPDLAAALHVPEELPSGELELSTAVRPTYSESRSGDGLVSSETLPRASRDRKKAKAAEERAVQIARRALEGDGWVLRRDRQSDGVGYDLLYARGERELHVEVKGIMSSTLAFNLTPKESWRVESDPCFVVIAVTDVLSPTAFRVELLDRARLASAVRVITGYRLTFEELRRNS